ncbi:MAG: alpha-galactosidase [Pirellulaceae bacterium]|nr:alpha-galactosidase [Pirellulaceae bacterium]
MRNTPIFVLLFLSFPTDPPPLAAAHPVEQQEARCWIGAKFKGIPEKQRPQAYLIDRSLGAPMRKNSVTTRVYYVETGALPLKIANTTYSGGLHCASAGKIEVHLPAAAESFEAVFGVDSNRVTSFYSNAGRGRVLGSVQIGDREAFHSQVMSEGMPGVPIKADINGASQFTLQLEGRPEGIVQRVNFNQADWANARVTMVNGETVKLGELPIGPLRSAYSPEAPFSFVYGGRHSSKFLKHWDLQRVQKQLDANRQEHTLTYTDPKTGLQVRCVGVEYHDFPVVEWKLFLKNTSNQPTPLIEDIFPIDTTFERRNEGEFILHHASGATHSLVSIEGTDYAPRETRLNPNSEKRLSSKAGLPASHDLPFWNIEFPGGGVVMAVGWPGQWAATLQRDKARSLHISAGQEEVHFRLLPGEEVRSPMIALLFWNGDDWIRAQNLWRRWMIAHNLPKVDGIPHPPQHAAGASAQYIEVSTGTEQNQLEFLKRYQEEGIMPDYWWIDAGWYEFSDYWLDVGTWRPDPVRFPRGLRPISNYLHQNDSKMILWFTPEVVTPGTAIFRDHPEWLLRRGGIFWWTGHALFQGEINGHVDDSGLTMIENVAAFGIGPDNDTVVGRTSLADGNWHLVTATRAVDKQRNLSDLRIYIDGKLDGHATSTNTRKLNANDSWGVGRQYQTRGISGDIDDARVYDVALGREEIAALFRRTETVAPVSHFALDGTLEDSGSGTVAERIGKGGPVYVSGASGKNTDRALRFDNNYGVKIKNVASDNFTLSCWVRMDGPQPPPYAGQSFRLFDLGNPEAVKWLTDTIDHQIKQQGVDLYRHDGIAPLAYWRAKDTEERQGISEIRHVEGYLRYWDELRRRNPKMRTDLCSGGGSRNELESLRRSVPLWRSDYAYEPTAMQSLTYGMAHWIPYFGTGTNAVDTYTFRSQMAPAIVSVWDLRRTDINFDFHRSMLGEWRQVSQYYDGDFYPLTTYSNSNEVWMAWQFHKPENKKGVIQAFRRPKSNVVSMTFKLRGLEPDRQYLVSNPDMKDSQEMSGRELKEQGLPLRLNQPRQAATIFYEQLLEKSP